MCVPVVAIPSESFPQLPLFYLFGNLQGLSWRVPTWINCTGHNKRSVSLQCAYRAHTPGLSRRFSRGGRSRPTILRGSLVESFARDAPTSCNLRLDQFRELSVVHHGHDSDYEIAAFRGSIPGISR